MTVSPSLTKALKAFLTHAVVLESDPLSQRLLMLRTELSSFQPRPGSHPVTRCASGYTRAGFAAQLQRLEPLLDLDRSQGAPAVLMELSFLLPGAAFRLYWDTVQRYLIGRHVGVPCRQDGEPGSVLAMVRHRLDQVAVRGENCVPESASDELDLQLLVSEAVTGIHLLACAVRVLLGQQGATDTGLLGARLTARPVVAQPA